MRSVAFVAGQTALAQQLANLRADAAGGASLITHQQLGYFTLSTNFTNGKTLTITVNGTAITLNGTTGTPTNPGDFKILGTATLTAALIFASLQQPQTTNSNFIALTGANQLLLSYLSFALSGTTLTVSSNNSNLYAPLTGFSASTTATSDTWTSQTMQLYVEPGTLYVGGTRVLFAGGSSPTVTAPSANPRIDVLTIDSTGTLAWTTGTENANPSAPTYPANKVPLIELYNVVGETALYDNADQQSGQGYISNDVRALLEAPTNWTAFSSDLIPDGDGTRNLGGVSNEWNNLYVKTGIFLNGTSISAQLNISGIAGESISANAAVALGYYQSDGGYKYDNSASGTFTGTGATISFAVGNNPNRVMIITLARAASVSAPTSSNIAISSTNPTIAQSQGTANGTFALAYLLAPTVATTNNIVFSGLNSGTWYYTIHSYYNIKQSGQPDASNMTVDGVSSTVTSTITTTANGALVFGAFWCEPGGQSATPGITNNVQNPHNAATLIAGDGGSLEPAGSYSAGGTFSGSTTASAIAISFAPVTVPVVAFINASSTANNARLTSFIGFANSSVSAGATLVVIVGGVAAGFTGLTYASQYYLNNTNGSIGTSPGSNSRKVGIAISTTQMLVTNIW